MERSRAALYVVSPDLPARLRRDRWRHEELLPQNTLYTGDVSTVWCVRDVRTGEEMVLKVYNKAVLTRLGEHHVREEAMIHCQTRHLNVLQLYAAWEDAKRFYVVTEYASAGDLYTEVHALCGHLSERMAVSVVVQPLLSVLFYLHGKGIIHRDVKPENILFAQVGNEKILKLADFGLAIDCHKSPPLTRVGTLDYMAPEVVRCPRRDTPEGSVADPRLEYDHKVDVWSLGALTYELLVGAPPFESDKPSEVVHGIQHDVPLFPDGITDEAKAFVLACLAKDAKQRPDVSELAMHDWINMHRMPQSARFENRDILRGLGGHNSWHGTGRPMLSAIGKPKGEDMAMMDISSSIMDNPPLAVFATGVRMPMDNPPLAALASSGRIPMDNPPLAALVSSGRMPVRTPVQSCSTAMSTEQHSSPASDYASLASMGALGLLVPSTHTRRGAAQGSESEDLDSAAASRGHGRGGSNWQTKTSDKPSLHADNFALKVPTSAHMGIPHSRADVFHDNGKRVDILASLLQAEDDPMDCAGPSDLESHPSLEQALAKRQSMDAFRR